jgi:hypothetical protein
MFLLHAETLVSYQQTMVAGGSVFCAVMMGCDVDVGK